MNLDRLCLVLKCLNLQNNVEFVLTSSRTIILDFMLQFWGGVPYTLGRNLKVPPQLRSRKERRAALFSASPFVLAVPVLTTDTQCKCGGLSHGNATLVPF